MSGFQWVVLFDQDSVVPPNFIDLMFKTYNDSPFRSQAGIVCPTYRDDRTDAVLPLPCSKKKEILAVPTSGSLIPVEIFQQVGSFNEDLFIDYVDVEFSLRIRKVGYRIIQSTQAVLRHSMGKITRHRFARRWFIATNHSAARRYYITRNRIWVLARYWRDWPWSPKEMKSALAEAIKIIFVEGDRLAKFRNIFLGCADAITGHMGKRMEL
jgi:rhamnosyltransferase